MASSETTTPDFLRRFGKTPYIPNGGWALSAMIAAEDCSGKRLLGPLAAATDTRRSAVFMALGAALVDHAAAAALSELAPHELVDWLLMTDPDEIVSVAFGRTIEGLGRMIEKTNGTPLARPEDYIWMAEVATGRLPRQRKQVQCLRHLPVITSDLIEVLKIVRFYFLRPKLVSALGPDSARHLEMLATHLANVAPAFGDDVMAQSLESGGGLGDLHRWASRAVIKHGQNLCPATFADDDDWVFLRSGFDFRRAADKLQNCIADIGRAAGLAASFGLVAFAGWRHGPVLAELRRMSDGAGTVWICTGVHGPCNAPVAQSVEPRVRQSLRRRGVLSLAFTAETGIPSELVERYGDYDHFCTIPYHAANGDTDVEAPPQY